MTFEPHFCYVADLRLYLTEYLEAMPVNPKGHKVFTYESAVGLQILERELEQATTLEVIKGGKFHETPRISLVEEILNKTKAA
jgi:hypothetical protein